MKAVSAILPISLSTSGLIIAWVSSLIAAWGIFAVGNHLHGRRVGILLALIWGVLPYALVESMGLSESLFTAIAAWALYALLTRRWFVAAGLTILAGWTRPTALALVAALGVAALVALWRREPGWWRPVLAAAIAPLGWLSYIVWVAVRLGRVDGWFYVEGPGWNSSFDGGRYTFSEFRQTLTSARPSLVYYLVTILLIITVVLLVLGLINRQPLPLLAYSLALLVMTASGTGFYHTDPRHIIIPAFPLFLPVAVAAARMRRQNLVTVFAILGAISIWLGAYLDVFTNGSF